MYSVIYPHNNQFPEVLREMHNGPKQLYCRGSLTCLKHPIISIVGARTLSTYGQRVIEYLIPGLVQQGFTIVSGLAYGVDAFVHKTTLDHGGLCVAVLAGGVEDVRPLANRSLAAKILQTDGVLISENAADTPVQKFHFPLRNRIVAGLSPVLLIIEAGDKSGTLITARYALESGRTVGVVPGDIFTSTSRGVHSLLKQGAFAITELSDILQHYSDTIVV